MRRNPFAGLTARLRALGRRGVAAMELALVMPLLLLTLVFAIDLGGALEQSIRLENAARNGAQYALSYPSDAAGIREQVRQSLPGWDDVQIDNPVLRCICPGNRAVNCGNEETCPTFTERYITISVFRPHRPILRTSLNVLGSVPVVQGRAEVRLR
jgi:hypothetical protein